MRSSVLDHREMRRFTVDEVLRMVDAGILGEDEPYELIGGQLVVVPPQGPEHAVTNTTLRDRLVQAYASVAHVREEKPLRVSDISLPEPDLAVVRGRPGRYLREHPGAADALLVIETAVTSHDADHAKASEYALGGIDVYWLLDVPARRVEVHTEPQPDGRYRVVRVLAGADEVELPELGMRWRVDELFPQNA